MPDQWDRFQASVEQMHRDFGFTDCQFLNFNETGVDKGQPTGDYQPIGTIPCEFVPPSADSTVDTEGTHLGFTTSVNALEVDLATLDEAIDPYGEDSQKPTRVVPDVDFEVTYEVQAPIVHVGSGIRKLRLTEV